MNTAPQKKKPEIIAIGFRCLPEGFSYVVLKGTQKEPAFVSKEKYKFPENMSRGQKLAWLRQQIFAVIQEHQPNRAGMKRAEPAAQQKSLERSEVEGVVKEAIFASKTIECNARIKSQLRRDIANFKEPARYFEKVLLDSNLSDLNNPAYQEATLAAIAELPRT